MGISGTKCYTVHYWSQRVALEIKFNECTGANVINVSGSNISPRAITKTAPHLKISHTRLEEES